MKKILLLSAAMMAFTVQNATAEDFSRADIENIVREYIEANPQVILDSVEAYGRQQQEEDLKKQQEAVKEHLGWLENNELLPVAGNPDGDVTVVEFFDYNCGYCKKALDDVMTLMEEDKNIKFVFIEMPILGQLSEQAAKWAVAAKNQDKYLEYHIALMKNRGPINDASLVKIAKDIGLDIEKLRKDAQSDEVADIVRQKASKASEMGISGTPAFIIGGELYGGYIGIDKMRKAVADVRGDQSEGKAE